MGEFFLALLGASVKMQCLPLIALGRFCLNKSTNQQEHSKTTKKKRATQNSALFVHYLFFLRQGLIALTRLELEL